LSFPLATLVIGMLISSQEAGLRSLVALRLTRISVDSASDALYWMTPEACVIDVNAAACRELGYTRQELLQLRVPDIAPHFNIEAWRQHFLELRQRGTLLFETEHRTKDGRVFPVEVSANYFKVGNTEYNCAFARDISERNLAFDLLQKNQRLLAETEKLGKVGGWEVLIDSGKLSWTDMVYEIHELERSFTPTVESAINFYTPESRATIEHAVQRAIDHGEPFDLELEITTAKGNRRCVHSIGQAELDRRRIYGFFQDITDQKQAVTALREQKLQYRNLADSGLALIWTAGTDKLCNYFNAPWLKFTGRALADELGNGWTEGVHPDDFDQCLKTYVEAFDKREAFGMEYRLRHHSGEYRWLQDIGTPNYDSAGEFIGYIGHCFDISDRKRLEQEKEKMQAHLNQAQKMEAIGVLAGGIAHDFNNILSAILGFTELAREDAPQGSRLAHDLDRVLTSAHRATELVKQILAFSRQSNADRVPLKIQPLIKESLKMLRASLPTTINIKEDISPKCGTILANPTQIHQIVMNLCTNAFHAMETAGGTLQVSVLAVITSTEHPLAESQSLPPGEYVELIVRDTGTGMGPEVVKKIFDPYFTTKDIGKGTGMGLSITHGIIRSYGGAITVESTFGQGTTFHLYFPVIQETAMASVEAQEPPRGSGRILFVDDEEVLMEMGRDMLQRLGYTVTAHSRSIEALATFMNEPDAFDLVITDQTMPALTGIELAKRMLQIRPDIPIILCTGYSNLVSEDSAKATGIRELAFKPLSRSSIGQLIKKVLSPVSAAMLS